MNEEKLRLMRSLRFPLLFVAVLWVIKGFEWITHFELTMLGVYPRKLFGMIGIVSSPLVHGDISHLVSNSLPIFFLGSLILYFYPSSARKVIFAIYILTGFSVWLLARPVYHIGASGLVYGFAFFLFFSGVFRNDVKSLAISFFIIFMYGGIIWGLLPNLYGISWESHLFGAIIGSLLAYHYRLTDISPKKQWAFPEDHSEVNYRYIYVPKEGREQSENSNDEKTSE